MGMYTEIFFRAEVDERAFTVIEAGINGNRLPKDDHPFFAKTRAGQLFRGGSAYFPGARHGVAEYDRHHEAFYVSFRADLKNYEGEVEAFFDWVTPHVVDEGFIGYSLYEEAGAPTLYWKSDD